MIRGKLLHTKIADVDLAVQQGGDYMFDERDADRTRERPSWFDRNQTSDQPRIPPPHQGRQHQEEFQGRPPQFRGRNFQRGRGASQGNSQRSPGRPSATMTSGKGLLASPLHAEPPVSKHTVFCGKVFAVDVLSDSV